MPRYRSLLSSSIACLAVVALLVVVVSRRAGDSIDRVRDNFSSSTDRPAPDTPTLSNTQTQRYVTPSLAELGSRGDFPETNEHVLMMTRVPGAGAELLVLLLQRLQGFNAFKHVRLPPGDDGFLTTLQQELLVEEITSIARREAIPLSLDGDARFLNFSAFARQAPAFLSMVRDPMDPRTLPRYKKGGTLSRYRGSISHFCGQDRRCAKRNNSWALKRAMDNVSRWYRVVGILNHMETTLEALERQFPYFFNGAIKLYRKIRPEEQSVVRGGPTLEPATKKRLENIFRAEIKFYEWLEARLFNATSDKG